MTGAALTLVSATNDGHRASYEALFRSLFNARIVRNWRHSLLDPAPALFLMIEENVAGYAIAGIIRAATGRKTVGLLFRPLSALRGATLRLRFKRGVLRLLKRLPGLSTLTITPFYVEPELATVADGWIHDPQLWDIAGVDHTGDQTLTSAIRQAADGRMTVIAIGRQDRDKGFDTFTALYANDAALRQSKLFAFVGALAPEMAAAGQQFDGADGWSLNRWVSDIEVFAAYAAADFVWCAYAPGYDQASGIFGRAVQLGLTPIVRQGSLLHRQCLADDIPHVAIDADNAAELLLAAKPLAPRTGQSQVAAWKHTALATLGEALGLSVPQ